MTLIYVALGGALGASLRYVTALVLPSFIATLCINIIGGLLIGLVWQAFRDKGFEAWLPFVMTGGLGGFTTFSTFSLETIRLMEAGKLELAAGYIFLSVTLSLGACFIGLSLARGSGL